MAADPGQFWKNWFAQREVSRLFQGNNFGTPPPTGGAVMGGAAPATPSQALVPITKEGVRVGSGVTETLASRVGAGARGVTPGMELVKYVAPAAEQTAARQGLIASARGALSSGWGNVAAGGLRGAILPAGIGIAGMQAGSALDNSGLLGGEESKLNDTASKALKWGGTGAGIGLAVGGPVGAAIGGAGGAVVGVLHEGAERQGWLGTPSKQEQIDTLVHDAEKSAARIGLPGEVVAELKAQFEAGKEFAKTKDDRIALAQTFAQNVQQYALDYATNPDAYQSAGQAQENADAQRLIQQSVMINAIRPYAENFLARSSAEADSYQNMAASAGDLAPMYQQMAAQTRASGARQAMEIVQQTQITPYMQALEKQAGYLNQISQQTMSQAIGTVMNPEQSSSGGMDLTQFIEDATNQLQP